MTTYTVKLNNEIVSANITKDMIQVKQLLAAIEMLESDKAIASVNTIAGFEVIRD